MFFRPVYLLDLKKIYTFGNQIWIDSYIRLFSQGAGKHVPPAIRLEYDTVLIAFPLEERNSVVKSQVECWQYRQSLGSLEPNWFGVYTEVDQLDTGWSIGVTHSRGLGPNSDFPGGKGQGQPDR